MILERCAPTVITAKIELGRNLFVRFAVYDELQDLELPSSQFAVSGAIGPVILGRAFDATGSYSSLLILLAAALGVAAATNLLLPRYADSFAIEVQ
jgi:hypothetical protein